MREHLVAHQKQHGIGAEMAELRPAQALLVVGKPTLE